MWKKGNIQQEIGERIIGFVFVPVNINGVADRLEGVKRQTGGNNQGM